MSASTVPSRRVLLLTSKLGYQTRAFVEAIRGLGLEVCFGTDRCDRLEDPWGDHAIPLKFEDPEESATKLIEFARVTPVHAVVALGDRPTPTAARVCAALGLPHHPHRAADVCRDKYQSREVLRANGLNVPQFCRFSVDDDFDRTVAGGLPVGFPCVLKPVALSGSRGVIRADNPAEAKRAFQCIRTMLRSPEIQALREKTSDFVQVERYVDGIEIAVEALMVRGRLKPLAIFDKPDPLCGPYFEETIYVTPSRLPQAAQHTIIETLDHAAHALGLYHGPVHAELRIARDENANGADESWTAWIMEVAARSIGGLCSRALRFHAPDLDREMSLEELIVTLAMQEDVTRVQREPAAAGVMMIPIPRGGVYLGVEGVEEALQTPLIEDVRITAKEGQELVPLPQGSSYLGFIFARATTPEQVEGALRDAHCKLRFVIGAKLQVV